jgi:hypothetical protein
VSEVTIHEKLGSKTAGPTRNLIFRLEPVVLVDRRTRGENYLIINRVFVTEAYRAMERVETVNLVKLLADAIGLLSLLPENTV